MVTRSYASYYDYYYARAYTMPRTMPTDRLNLRVFRCSLVKLEMVVSRGDGHRPRCVTVERGRIHDKRTMEYSRDVHRLIWGFIDELTERGLNEIKKHILK